MNEERRDLAAAAALGALAPEELARLEEEAARDPELAARLEEYRAAVALLETAVARERPPEHLLERVLERVEREERGAPSPRARGGLGRLLAAAALAASAGVAVLAVALAVSGTGPGRPDARAEVRGTPAFPGVHGEALLFGSGRPDGRLVLRLGDVPAPGPGRHYEVWVLREEGEGEMESVGVFSPAGRSVRLELPLPGPGRYQAVDVSVEPDGGPPEHSGRSLAGGRFRGES